MSKLEDEIKQYSFKSEFHKAILNLIFTGNWISARHKKFFTKYDISTEQYNVLRILRGQYPKSSTVQSINERMLDKMSNVSRLVEKLRLKSLITRAPSESDRRQVDINISKAGLDLLKIMDQEIETLQISMKKISNEECLQLNMILDKLRD